MGSSKRLAELYDRQANEKHLASLAKSAPLQSLSAKELELDRRPLTIYPRPRRCRAWILFGPHPIRVEAILVRSTETAAGIEFKILDVPYRCWVWGPAIELVSPASTA